MNTVKYSDAVGALLLLEGGCFFWVPTHRARGLAAPAPAARRPAPDRNVVGNLFRVGPTWVR